MTIVQHLLVVADDVSFRQTMAEQLRLYEQYAVTTCQTAAEALDRSGKVSFRAIFIDVALPDMDGCELCRLMRSRGVTYPIVMLSGTATESDIIRGLDSGANDYVSKPLRIGILLARLRAHIRQHERSEDAVLAVGPYEFSPAQRLLMRKSGGEKILLSSKEAQLLKKLYRARGNIVGKDALLKEVWGYSTAAKTHTLETHIYRLRRKLNGAHSEVNFLITESGGYRLAQEATDHQATCSRS